MFLEGVSSKIFRFIFYQRLTALPRRIKLPSAEPKTAKIEVLTSSIKVQNLFTPPTGGGFIEICFII